MSDQKWAIRAALPQDIDFIYSTWLNSYHYDSWTKGTQKHVYFDNYPLVLDQILDRSLISVACLPDDAAVILGYMVYEKEPTPSIHYTYTKEPFRELGIQKSLFNEAFDDVELIQCTHKTRSVAQFFREHRNFIFNPFVLYKGV